MRRNARAPSRSCTEMHDRYSMQRTTRVKHAQVCTIPNQHQKAVIQLLGC